MKEQQIIFLDVDGVLTSMRCNGYYDFDLWAVHFLLYCCKNSNTKIVMSSAWRCIPEAKEWFTDLFGKHLHTDWRTGDRDHRGMEIREWLRNHSEVTNYVIIDDSAYDIVDLPEHITHFVHTSTMDGLLWKRMLEVREILHITAPMPIQQEIVVKDVCFMSVREGKRKAYKLQLVQEEADRHARSLVQEAADETTYEITK